MKAHVREVLGQQTTAGREGGPAEVPGGELLDVDAQEVARLRAESRDVLLFRAAWDGDPHAGHAETSLMLHLAPDLVDMSLAARNVPERLVTSRHVRFGGPAKFGWLANDFGPGGVIGDPTLAVSKLRDPAGSNWITPHCSCEWSAGRSWPHTATLEEWWASGSQTGSLKAANDGFGLPPTNSSPVWNVAQYAREPGAAPRRGALSISSSWLSEATNGHRHAMYSDSLIHAACCAAELSTNGFGGFDS